MRLLAIEHDHALATRPDLHDILRVEAAAIWDLQKRGIVREIWFTASRHRIVMLLECGGALEARNHLAGLPMVRQGLSEFELIELATYDGCERLFGGGLVAALKPDDPPEY